MNTYNNSAKPVAWLEKQLNVGVITYILLAMVTFGIYPIVFCFKITARLKMMHEDLGHTSNRLRTLLLVNLFGAVGYLVFAVMAAFYSVFAALSIISLISAVVAGIWWAFEARSMMIEYYAKEHGFPMKINGFLLFFFCNIMLLLAANSAERQQQLHKHVR